MSECEYHPGVEAKTTCRRCGREICENCVRNVQIGQRRNKALSLKYQYCIFCYSRSKRSSGKSFFVSLSFALSFMIFIYIRYSVTGKMLFFDKTQFFILAAIAFISFLISFIIVIIKGSSIHYSDRKELVENLTWKHPGDADVSINELLELTPAKLQKHVNFILHELRTSPEDVWVRKIVNSVNLTPNNIGQLLLYLEKDITHWCWRSDLSEKNIKRTSLAFVYTMGVSMLGKERMSMLIDQCPFIVPDIIEKILLTEEQAASLDLKRQPAKKLPEQRIYHKIIHINPK